MNDLTWTRAELWPWALAAVVAAAILAWRAAAILTKARRNFHWSLLDQGRDVGGYWRAALRALALVFFAVALLGPSYGYREELVAEISRPVILAVDMSKSVRAMDVAPDRLTRIREVVANLMASFPAYKYALILFAGDARYRVPFTYDHGFVQFVLNETKPEDVAPQGTDLKAPLELAIRIADTQQLKDATLILVTDGEHTGQGDPAGLIPFLRDRGIRVLAVGVGDAGGAPIPLPDGGYIKDKQGEVVFSKPDLDLLQRVATGTGGLAHNITGGEFNLNPLAPLLAQIEAARGKESQRRTPIDRAEWPLGLGCLLFALSLLPLRVFAWRQSKAAVAALVLALAACSADHKARQALEQDRPDEAAAWYANRAAETGEAAALANLGASLFAQENFATAATAFALAATREGDQRRRGDDLFNAGNAYFKAGDLQKAVELYEAALKERDDEDTAFNLELAKRLLQQLQQQQQQQKQNQDQTSEQQEQQEQAGEGGQQQQEQQGQPSQAPDQEQQPGQSQAQAAQAGAQQAEEPTERKDDLGVLLQQRIDRLQEGNPMKLKGQGADAERPW